MSAVGRINDRMNQKLYVESELSSVDFIIIIHSQVGTVYCRSQK